MTTTRSYNQNTIKKLYGASGGHCSMCKSPLIISETSNDKSTQIGEIAHIFAFSEKGPRANSDLSKSDVNKYENLILLCPNCHKKIDNQPKSYPPDKLKNLKRKHEQWVSEKLDASISNMGNAELEIAVRNISSNKYFDMEMTDFDLTTIKEKIDKNQLNTDVQSLITKGLFGVKEVKSFINEINKIDPEFILNLQSFFKKKYRHFQKLLGFEKI